MHVYNHTASLLKTIHNFFHGFFTLIKFISIFFKLIIVGIMIANIVKIVK
jgi:hypothetical protein